MSLTTYAEMASVIDCLPVLVRERRRQRRLTLREAAAEAGLAASVLCRVEHGTADPAAASLRKLLAWLDGGRDAA